MSAKNALERSISIIFDLTAVVVAFCFLPRAFSGVAGFSIVASVAKSEDAPYIIVSFSVTGVFAFRARVFLALPDFSISVASPRDLWGSLGLSLSVSLAEAPFTASSTSLVGDFDLCSRVFCGLSTPFTTSSFSVTTFILSTCSRRALICSLNESSSVAILSFSALSFLALIRSARTSFLPASLISTSTNCLSVKSFSIRAIAFFNSRSASVFCSI
mmetsp:Transcript_5619/g.7381  ORF Transcript_5619/g.7381 Transcript_5619/m.7381 type:complete len:216 (-) Transcript_5619:76-723(-)